MNPGAERLSGLIAGARRGDPRAFEDLYRMFPPSAARVARGMLSEEQAVEDVLQDVLFSVFQKIGRLKDDASFRSWLFAILINRCRESFRARRPLLDRPAGRPADGPGAEDRFGISELVRELPQIDRDIFNAVLQERRP